VAAGVQIARNRVVATGAAGVRAFAGGRGILSLYRTGQAFDCSRGTGNSHTLIFAPELWPDLARDWYAAYARHFWQDQGWAAGFREYPRDAGKPATFFEIDAGPIIRGFSPAANAFGLAACCSGARGWFGAAGGPPSHAGIYHLPATLPLRGLTTGTLTMPSARRVRRPYRSAILFNNIQRPTSKGLPQKIGTKFRWALVVGC
jgi:hypothetical protein